MSKITVVGSINMDLVTSSLRVPEAGETVFGQDFAMVAGGKGANQAVAAGRLSNEADEIQFIGAVGDDLFGRDLLANFEANQVLTEFVGTVPQSTGIAQITLFDEDNRIIIVAGANNEVKASQFDKEWELLKASDLVILQNEIPHETNLAIVKFCRKHNVKVLYNPAPARDTDLEMIDYVDFISPNEHESKELFPDMTLEQALEKYPNQLLVTLGVRGVTFYDGEKIQLVPAIKAKVVDTTGAGDTWNGAFGFALTRGLELKEAVRFAVIVSHLSVQKFGAQGGMPTLKEVKEHEAYVETWNIK